MALFASRRSTRADPRPAAGLRSRDFLLLLVATLGTFSNYAPLLSVVSLWSAEGGSGHGGVGAATGVTMATTVGVQLVMRRLLRRYGLRRILVAGALLLGVPTFCYPVSDALSWVLAVSAVRGTGFGMVAVAGSALVAELVPAALRGRAVGRYGVAVGLPQVVCLPLGVWCAQRFGFVPVFVVTGALSVAAAPLAALISGGPPRREESSAGRPRGLGSLAGPWLTLLTSACALGGATSFLPLAPKGPGSAPAALFLLSAAVIAGRWAAGSFNDRVGPGHLLVPGVLGCVLGTAGLALAVTGPSGQAAWAAASACLYGAAFGALQNDTLVVMFCRAGPGGHGTAGTVWNMAYDAGTGVGAVAVGMLSRPLGIAGALAATAALILAVSPLAWHGPAAARSATSSPARSG